MKPRYVQITSFFKQQQRYNDYFKAAIFSVDVNKQLLKRIQGFKQRKTIYQKISRWINKRLDYFRYGNPQKLSRKHLKTMGLPRKLHNFRTFKHTYLYRYKGTPNNLRSWKHFYRKSK